MNKSDQFVVQSETRARILGLYPALMVVLVALAVPWTSSDPRNTIALIMLVAGAYAAIRAFQMRHRKFERVADTKAIAYWIYGTSVALVALLASSTIRAAGIVLMVTLAFMYVVIKRKLFPVVTSANRPPQS